MSCRTLTTISPLLLAAALLLGSVAEAGPTWNPPAAGSRMSLSQQAGRTYGRQLGNYQGAMRAARRQFDGGRAKGVRNNLLRAFGSQVKMLRAQARGLHAKKEAAFTKAQAMEKAGDKAGAEVWRNKAAGYESKALSKSRQAARLAKPEVQDRLAKRYEGKWGSQPGTGGAEASSPPKTNAETSWKAAGKDYNTLRRKQLGHRVAAQNAYQRYRKTGDAEALKQTRLASIKMRRATVAMYGVQARALEAKAASYAKAGNLGKANEYSGRAHKLQTRARGLASSTDRFEAKLRSGQLKNPRISARRKADVIEDGPGATQDGPDMDFTNDGPEMGGAPQAMDTEGAPGVDGPKIPGIGSRQGKKAVNALLSSAADAARSGRRGGHFLVGALDTLERMEAQANRGGIRGLVDRYRKWSTKRTIIKEAYKAGKRAAQNGNVDLAAQSADAIYALGKPGRGTDHKVRTIGNKALTGAKRAYKTHDGQLAKDLLDLSWRVQESLGRTKPTWRFRRVRAAAKREVWKDVKAYSKDGNIEAFRAAVSLASAYAKEDGHEITGKEFGKLRKLIISAKKTSVVRARQDAQALRQYGGNPEEIRARENYADQTALELNQRGVKIPKRIKRNKPSLFARWWKQGGGRTGPDIAPFPRTRAQFAEERAAQREMKAIQEGLATGQIDPRDLPPQLLHQMGYQVPPEMMQQAGAPQADAQMPPPGYR